MHPNSANEVRSLALARTHRRSFRGDGSKVLDPVSAIRLSSVKAGVGLIQQYFHIGFSFARRDGDSHTHGKGLLDARIDYRCIRNDFSHLIRTLQRVGQITVGQNQKELLSAISAHTVVNAELPPQSSSDFTQRFVSKKMAKRVVHALEMIDVAKNHTHRLVFTTRTLQFPLQHG